MRSSFLKWRSNFRNFHKTLKIFSDFSQENHGHGGHGHGVHRGFSGVSFHLEKCPQGVAFVLFQKTPTFGSRRPKLDHLAVIQGAAVSESEIAAVCEPGPRTARKPVPCAFVCTLFPRLAARCTSRSIPTETAPGGGSRKQGANDSK